MKSVPILLAAVAGGMVAFAIPFIAQAQSEPSQPTWTFFTGKNSGSMPHGWLLNTKTGTLWYCVNESPPVCVPVPKKP